MEENPKGKPKVSDQGLDALGPDRGSEAPGREQRGARGLPVTEHRMGTQAGEWLPHRRQEKNYCLRKNKVLQLKARTETQSARRQ